MSTQIVDIIKRDAQGDVQFQAMRVMLRAQNSSLTDGIKEEHFGSMREIIAEAIERAYACGWDDRGRMEEETEGLPRWS